MCIRLIARSAGDKGLGVYVSLEFYQHLGNNIHDYESRRDQNSSIGKLRHFNIYALEEGNYVSRRAQTITQQVNR